MGLFKKKPQTPKVVELADIAQEYVYVQQLKCEKCNGPVSSTRAGASGPQAGRTIDHWVIKCNRCSHTIQVDLSVPAMDFAKMFGLK